jgi:hypothetical protein
MQWLQCFQFAWGIILLPQIIILAIMDEKQMNKNHNENTKLATVRF